MRRTFARTTILRVLAVGAFATAGLHLVFGSATSYAVEFCITAPIVGATVGPSAPYPSPIVVSGLAGTTTDVNVSLLDFTTFGDANGQHWPEDVDVLLVGPDGTTNVVLMSDAGGDNDTPPSGAVIAADLLLDEQATNQLPADSPVSSGSWRPVDDDDDIADGGDDWPTAPAPGGTALSAFNNGSPNGTWNLYVVDDHTGASANFNGGWCVDILTSTPSTTTTTTPGTTTTTTTTSSTTTTTSIAPTTSSTTTTTSLPPTTTSTTTSTTSTTTSTSTSTTAIPTTTSTIPATTTTDASTTSSSAPSTTVAASTTTMAASTSTGVTTTTATTGVSSTTILGGLPGVPTLPPGGLPSTGSSTRPVVLMALGLLALGAAAIIAAARRAGESR